MAGVNESLIFRTFNKNLFGTMFLISKLKEEPFFVETNPISAEPTSDPYHWKFSSNPLVCNVYDEPLEKISIFMLHCAHYYIKDTYDFTSSEFPELLDAYRQLLDRIYVELNRTTEFENVAAAFNVIVIMRTIFDRYTPSILLKQNSNAVLNICENIEILKEKFKSIYTVDHHQLTEIFESALMNLYVGFKNAVDLTKHNDLRFETSILTDEEDLFVFRSEDEFWHNVEDTYYNYPTCTIEICDDSDFVEIYSWVAAYYPAGLKKYEKLTDYPHYTSSDELFNLCEENSLNSKENMDILKRISHLRRNANDALLVTNVEFFQLVSTFAVNFFNRKNRRDYKNEIVILNKKEMLFLFEFVTELIMTLNEFLLWSGKILENLIPAVLRKLTKVMNSVKFQEILNVVTDYHVYHIMASLNSLIDNPNIVSILPQTPGNLLLILTKIYVMVHDENHEDTKGLRDNGFTKIFLFPVQYIHTLENIPKRRRSIWKKLLVKGSTAQSCLDRFQGICSICLNTMDASSTYSLLVCGHAFCYACLDSLLKNESLSLPSSFCCPNCRVSCRDVVISSSIESICEGLENL